MMTTTSSDEDSEFKQAADMLMRAVQNYTGATAPGRRSASTGRRRRRKRPRIQCSHSNEDSFNDAEPGPSGASSRSEVNLPALQSGRNVHAVTHSGHSSQLQLAPTHSHRASSRGALNATDGTVSVTAQFQRTQRDQQTRQPAAVQTQPGQDDLVRHRARSLMGNPPGLSREPQGQRIRQPVDYSSNRYLDGGSHVDSSSDYNDTQNGIMSGRQAQSQRRDLIVQRPPAATMHQSAVLEEHSKIFKFNPSKQYTAKCHNKGKGPATRSGTSYWKKNTFCLSDHKQQFKPTPEEKIALAKIGLEVKCLLFNLEGNTHHVHDVIMKEWPILEKCGGYTLLRLAENSHSFVEIEPPLSGHISVQFLKAILNNATMYVRPLQCSICYEDMKQLYPCQVYIRVAYIYIKHFAWEGSKGKECYIFHKVARWKI